MTFDLERLHENLTSVRERIASAANRSGRAASGVTLVAVTKFAPVAWLQVLVAKGCHDLGESRPQEFWTKTAALDPTPVRWHFVGHLQRNKVARTLPTVHLLHSLDSLRLAETIDQEAAKLGRPIRALAEINISGEPAKHGFSPAEIETALPRLAALRGISIVGLMGMAALAGGSAAAARDFAALAALRDRLASNCPSEISLTELSMGMSDDFEIAIEHGATLVRVGSALFEGLESSTV